MAIKRPPGAPFFSPFDEPDVPDVSEIEADVRPKRLSHLPTDAHWKEQARGGSLDDRKQYPDGRWRFGYSPERAEFILLYLASGHSLRQALEAMKEKWGSVPHRCSYAQWIALDIDGYRQRLRDARSVAADAFADEMLNVMDEVRGGDIKPDAGRVILQGMQWIAGKLKPEDFGERVEHKLTASSDFVAALEALDRGQRAKVIEHDIEP